MKEKKIGYNFRIPASLKKRLENYCDDLGISLNDLLVIVSREYIDKKEFEMAEIEKQKVEQKKGEAINS